MIFEIECEVRGKHYLYLHTRLDTNEVFYVGIGTKYNHDKDYTRAKTKGKRNNIWQGIVNRTEYKISIIQESDLYEEIKALEIKLIKQYGRIITNEGKLANLSGGGDGTLGFRDENKIKPVYLYLKTGGFFKEFDAYADCTRFLKTSKCVVQLAINKNFLVKGYIIKDFKTDSVTPIPDIKEKLKTRLSKPIYQYDDNLTLIKEWGSSSEASRILSISGGHIRQVANGCKRRKKAGGFIWKYEKV